MAQVSDIRVDTNPSEHHDNVVVNDIYVNFTGQLTGFQLLVELESGGVYQNPSALIGTGATPPVGALLAVDETLVSDTYTAFGGPTAEDNAGNYGLGGGAVNLGGDPAAQFDTQGVNQAWNPAGGVVVSDRTDFLAARIALTDDANGSVVFAGYAGGQDPGQALQLQMPIINGAIIPEPSSIAIVAVVVCALAASIRRKA
jgi:hypothetical protein